MNFSSVNIGVFFEVLNLKSPILWDSKGSREDAETLKTLRLSVFARLIFDDFLYITNNLLSQSLSCRLCSAFRINTDDWFGI